MADSASLPVINSGSFAADTPSLERIEIQQEEAAMQASATQKKSVQLADDTAAAANSNNESKPSILTPLTLSPVQASEPGLNQAPTDSTTTTTTTTSSLQPDASTDDSRAIAQAVPNAGSRENDFVPIDLTPVKLPERTSAFSGLDAYKASALYRLPARFFFNASVENSLRFEVNTFQTNRHYLSDMVYRVLPNVTMGYALDPKTRVSANYFFFRDQYTLRNNALSRNIHSIGGRIDRDIKINDRTNATLGFMPRVLFINTANAPSILYNDLLPSVVVTRRVGQSGLIYGSIMGQTRWHGILSGFQEFDQFYSFGSVTRRGPWNFLFDTTLNTNFGSRRLRRGPNNQVIIMTMEAGRRINPRYPVTAFVRAEPIFNIGANHTPGYAGFNFRIYGGIRAEVAKPPIFPIKLKQG
jgi:hypothetical protein